MGSGAPRAYPSWKVIAELYIHGSPLQSATMVVGICEKSGSEGSFRIWVLASDFSSLLLLSGWHSFTIKWGKHCLVSLDFLIALVLLTVLCSLMAPHHMPVFFSVPFPTYWENTFSPFDTEFTQLTSGGRMLLTLLSSPFLPELLAKFQRTQKSQPDFISWQKEVSLGLEFKNGYMWPFIFKSLRQIYKLGYEHGMPSEVIFCFMGCLLEFAWQ